MCLQTKNLEESTTSHSNDGTLSKAVLMNHIWYPAFQLNPVVPKDDYSHYAMKFQVMSRPFKSH
jgi:hypothetical protein